MDINIVLTDSEVETIGEKNINKILKKIKRIPRVEYERLDNNYFVISTDMKIVKKCKKYFKNLDISEKYDFSKISKIIKDLINSLK